MPKTPEQLTPERYYKERENKIIEEIESQALRFSSLGLAEKLGLSRDEYQEKIQEVLEKFKLNKEALERGYNRFHELMRSL